MDGYIHIFCNSESAFGAGHVGWGFEAKRKPNGSRLYYYGSYDNNDNNDGGLLVWYEFGTGQQMVQKFMNEKSYDGWKYLWVQDTNLQRALDAQHKWINRFYFALGSNCLNCVFDILSAYGTPGLPSPFLSLQWRPKDWFASFQGNKGGMSFLK